MIGRCDDFDEQIVRKFIDKNRLRWKDIITIFSRLVMSRSWIGDFHGETGFEKLDTVIKKMLKEEGHENYADMTFVERYLGYGLRPVTRTEVLAISEIIRDEKIAASKSKIVEDARDAQLDRDKKKRGDD